MLSDQYKNKVIRTAIFFVALLVISLVFYSLHLHKRRGVILFYPDFRTGLLLPEERYIMNRKSNDLDLQEFMDELLLGPAKTDRTPLLPRETKVDLVYLSGKRAEVKLSHHFLNKDSEIPLDFPAIVQSIVNNLLFNFSYLKGVDFYIEGEKLPEMGREKIYENRFDPSLLK